MKRNYRSIKTIVLTFTIFMTSLSYAQVGGLDPTFNDSGRVVTDFNGNSDVATDVAIQSDNKILVAGHTQYFSGSIDADFSVARYNSDGSLDQSFGTGGLVNNHFNTAGLYGQKFAVQDDGKFVIAGAVSTSLGEDMAVARFNSDFSPDTTFGTAGLVTIHTTNVCGLSDVVIQTDGKILAAGWDDNDDFIVLRLNQDGSLDTDFGNSGFARTGINNHIDVVNSILLQKDSKIIVAGNDHPSLTQSNFMTVRYNPDGSLDTGFGSNGIVIYDVSGNEEYANAALLQSDGKIVVGGFTRTGFNPGHILLVRYNTDGTLDAGFGNSGVVIAGAPSTEVNSLIIQPDNKIVAAGANIAVQFQEEFLLARFNSNGTIDTEFGTNGYITTPGAGAINSATLQTDGKLVAVGSVTEIPLDPTSDDFSVARYDLGNINTSVQSNKNTFPTNFTLEQNYPNPFNPSTTIEFSIPKESFVTLKVYDLLGREVATLVNEKLPTGTYSRVFNAENLSSGVYFYRLEAKNFSQTRKLILTR